MPIFNYEVANKQGKKLAGTVEAPDEQTARSELNNLGFSILNLKLTTTAPQIDPSLTKYVFEAVDKSSKLVTGTIPAKDQQEAFTKLSQEYELLCTAIWKEGAPDEEIQKAKKEGTASLQALLEQEVDENTTKSLAQQKEDQFIRTKIEFILDKINELLKTYDQEFEPETKNDIHKKINKLLRIKQSKNIKYILATAEDLLKFVQEQEENLKDKDHQEKRIDLHMKTKKLLDELNKTSNPKTISEDIVQKIDNFEKSYSKQTNPFVVFLNKILLKIKDIFTPPPQIQAIKEQIKVYNKQLWEFIKLYFKEKAPEYKAKVKESIKTVWETRKKAKHSLKQAKKLLKERRKGPGKSSHIMLSLTEEVNALTGWLLAFYLIYYIVSLYITTKDFGLSEIPKGFYIYDTQVFKYLLVILFLLHASTSIKLNFFKQSKIATVIIVPIFIFSSIIVLLNF